MHPARRPRLRSLDARARLGTRRCSRFGASASTRAPRRSTRSTSCSDGEPARTLKPSRRRVRDGCPVRRRLAVFVLIYVVAEVTIHSIFAAVRAAPAILGKCSPHTGCLTWQVRVLWLFTMLHQIVEIFVAVTIGYTFRAQPFNVLFQQAREPTVCIASPPRSSAVVVASAALVLAGAAGGDRARRADAAVDYFRQVRRTRLPARADLLKPDGLL